MKYYDILCILSTASTVLDIASAFSPDLVAQKSHSLSTSVFQLNAAVVDIIDVDKTKQAVGKLKKVLEREYISFFAPMQKEFYAPDVSFDDPMTSLTGVDAYQNNIDMLASRTLLGKFLFQDAGIALHSIEGGEVAPDGSISNIMTRWTLRVTAKVLPWTPIARFSGVSIYEVGVGGSEGVIVGHQTDYWDSINILDSKSKGGDYGKVDKGTAIKHFLGQLKPENANAISAGPEVPYQLLRCGNGYEVRQYPSCTVARIPYDRRDEGYDILATVTKGAKPLAPSLQEVSNDDNEKKTMAWPLAFAAPGEKSPPSVKQDILDKVKDPLWSVCEIETLPSAVVAIGTYADASVGPIVRRADKELRDALQRDGIDVPSGTDKSVKFAQYDAIYSLGKRRGEVWIELEDGGHPW